MPLIDDMFDLDAIDPEIEEYINFLNADEQENTGFLTKKRVDDNAEGVLRM